LLSSALAVQLASRLAAKFLAVVAMPLQAVVVAVACNFA
jgi:hypothetical protein